MEQFNKLSMLKSWKNFVWFLTFCIGMYCLFLVFGILLQELPENITLLNRYNLPYYILFAVMLLHSISMTVIYRTLDGIIRSGD